MFCERVTRIVRVGVAGTRHCCIVAVFSDGMEVM
jgi:hypothetical protein